MIFTARRTMSLGLAAVLATAAVVGCARDGDNAGQSQADSTTAIDRLIIGQAAGYKADPDMRASLPKLKASQAERRKTAWQVIQRVIEPVSVDDGGRSMPRFQTWYGKDEIIPMFEHVLLGQSEADRRAHVPPTPAQVEEAFEWAAKRATSLASFSEDRLAQRRAELDDAGNAASLGGQERVLMSPALVGHLLTNYDAMLRCVGAFPDAKAAPPSTTNFAPCVGDEFPIDAVLVKARWVPTTLQVPVPDTSAAGLGAVLGSADQTWPDNTHLVDPGPNAIYTMNVSAGLSSRLIALHVASKELRDWMWISMFWSDEPGTDFGSDRPAEMNGPWSGYKMCSVVDFDEGDDGAHDDAFDPTLAAAFGATRALGQRSWCSNPNLEQGAHNAKTNCIGCHQHAGTDLTTTTIIDGDKPFPDGSRAKARENFPADYTFVTTTGIGLNDLFRAKLDQLVPPNRTP